MTETNMITSNPYDGERRPGTVGFPLPGVEVRVVDAETGPRSSPGEVGVRRGRGPNVFAGYWRQPERTAEEFRADGFFLTGDLGAVDADGYLQHRRAGEGPHHLGRAQRVPEGGRGRCSTSSTGSSSRRSSASPTPTSARRWWRSSCRRAGRGSWSEDACSAALGDRLARFKQPKRVVVVDELPRNAMAKVQKNVLREQFGATFEG